MMLMLCGQCQMDMYIWKIDVVVNESAKTYDHVYHVRCENNHAFLVHSTSHPIPDRDSLEYRIIDQLRQRAEINND